MTHAEFRRGEFVVSTDPELISVDRVHEFLSRSYWSPGVGREVVERSIRHSLCFGLYREEEQIGFGRVVTDYASFGYVADVYVLEEWRGRGLGKWFIECIVAHPDLQSLRRLLLATRDAHGLYRKIGFKELAHPEFHMERRPQGWREP